MELYIIYYVILLLLFGYWVIFHNPAMNSISAFTPAQPSIDDQVEELDENSHYHHPTWSHRWSHPNFTEQAMRAWRKEPWYGDHQRLSSDFLYSKGIHNFPWGYIIYRTVYTAESDKLWPLAMAKLHRFIKHSIMQDYSLQVDRYGDNSRPEQLVQESHKDVIISDKQRWDGAGIEQIRQHFKSYLGKTKLGMDRGRGRFEACMVIDERSLKSIIASPEPGSKSRFRQPYAFVGMADGWHDLEQKGNPGYSGFMRVEIDYLWELYVYFGIWSMDELCPSAPPGFISVYDWWYGEAMDEEGNVHKFPTRPPGLESRARE
ncbi:hypothetical protein BDV33DRAFT_168892 [Aspergillus novoparasiticus]|uniref:Uncharacterized protein n=1 Tax=Aspergillus novoparasiticus TaxID=986946 RepID=A0A5N6EZH7_9EURO|nr:hypothetical protein BDV33DRAFT_168892 [Aspergillus novoparasiticus]